MKDNPIVTEVRRIRHEHAARFQYDLDLIVKDLKAQEQASGRSYIRLPPRRTTLALHRPSKRKSINGPQGA